MTEDRLLGIIEALQRPTTFGHRVIEFEIVETHISYVLLTGPYAYKFKKPVDLGFLDFSSLAKRKFFIEEELRLNRRLAPSLYLDIVPVTGAEDSPMLRGEGPVLEYALKMVQFPPQAQLDRVLAQGGLSPDLMDDLALQIARFHQQAPAAEQTGLFGTPERITQTALANFDGIVPLDAEPELRATLERLRGWTESQAQRLAEQFWNRKREGRIRECHGDLHLTNMVLLDGRVVPFDCIEFSAALRFIDVMSEVAFLVMDLDHRGNPPLAQRFLNRYLEHTGDYGGLRVLDFYRAYRSLVRAMVADIERREKRPSRDATERLHRHVALAARYALGSAHRWLAITHGLSGSGKTSYTGKLLELCGAVRVRSDVERKRLGGLAPQARSESPLDQGLYRPDMTERTYQHLRALSASVLESGSPVVVDASFLKRRQRQAFLELAREQAIPYFILDFKASPETLRSRVARRQREGNDASEAGLEVLAYQRAWDEPLGDAEQRCALSIDADRGFDVVHVAERLNRREPRERTDADAR